MKIDQLRLGLVAVLVAAAGACAGSSPLAPEEQEARPTTRTACMAGGDVAQRAGCPEDTWQNDEYIGDPSDGWDEDVRPREKRPELM